MIKLHKQNDYKIMPWKNGLGVTTEIAIHPADANFPQDDFLWRFSSAKVQAQNNFSNFNGCDRVLAVVKGEGLILNGELLKPLTPLCFSGITPINCELISGEVIDLGVIYKKEKFDVKMTAQAFEKSNEPQSISLQNGVNFIFCVSGKIRIDGVELQEFDSIEIQNVELIQISIFESAKCLFILISARNPLP